MTWQHLTPAQKQALSAVVAAGGEMGRAEYIGAKLLWRSLDGLERYGLVRLERREDVGGVEMDLAIVATEAGTERARRWAEVADAAA